MECLQERADAESDRLAIFELAAMREPRSPLTYRQLDRRVRAVAAGLERRGAAGQRVLLAMGNDIHYVVAFLACSYAGCVAVNLAPPTRPKHLRRLAHVAEDCGAHLLLAGGPGASALERQLSELPRLRELAVLRVDAVSDEDAEAYAVKGPSPKDLCYLQYTSGSTGAPRGVMVSHQNLVWNSDYIQRTFDFGPEDKALSWLPLYHDMGLILGVLQPIFSGFPVGLADPISFIKHPDRWLRAISEHRITYTGGPNFGYDLCVDAVDPSNLEDVDLSCWEVALNAAEPIRSRTLTRFAEAFAPLGFRPTSMHPGYGLAELTLEACAKVRGTLPLERVLDAESLSRGEVRAAAPGARARRVISSGRIAPGMEVRIVDPRARIEAQPHQIGEIWIHGPSVALGYWGHEELTRATFGARIEGDARDHLRTGDLGFLEGRELFITGRLKDVLIVHGANYYPQDIEETVELADEAIRPHFTAAFAAEEGERERLIVLAEIRREAADSLDVGAAARRVFQAVAREHEVPLDEVVFVHHGQIPKTTSGKIQRAACRERWRSGAFQIHGAVARGGTRQDHLEVVHGPRHHEESP